MGGYRVQRDAERLLADAREVQAAGAFSVVLEGIPADIAKAIDRGEIDDRAIKALRMLLADAPDGDTPL